MTRGGAPLPLHYFGMDVMDAGEGSNQMAVRGNMVRPAIGGKRRKRITKSRNKTRGKTRGGFYPSVMGNFIAAASKYIVPAALFAGFKLMQKTKKRSRTH